MWNFKEAMSPDDKHFVCTLCGFRILDFYAVGLKRGFRALGFIPKRREKYTTRITKTSMRLKTNQTEDTIPGTSPAKRKSSRYISTLRIVKSTDQYYRYKCLMKYSFRVPLSIGRNYILWAEKS